MRGRGTNDGEEGVSRLEKMSIEVSNLVSVFSSLFSPVHSHLSSSVFSTPPPPPPPLSLSLILLAPPSMQSAMDLWQKNLSELEGKYRITNKILLAKSSIVLLVVILLFFLSNTIPNVELELGKPL